MAIIGVNTFLWTTQWRGKARRLLSRIKALGFDAVQIPILDLSSFDIQELRSAVQDLELTCYVSAGLKDHLDITDENPETRRRGVEFLKGCVHLASELGVSFLSGSFHSVFGKKSREPVKSIHWDRSAEALRPVARKAREYGLELVLEPINRYESFLVNTADQARRLIDLIGEPNVKIQLDTFHMNLEEEDFYRTIVSVGNDLRHFHVAESHRGRFGCGMMRWEEIFLALSAIGYRGAIVIESFVPEVAEVASAACIWRKMVPSADVLAGEGLEFIRNLAAKHGL